MDYFSSPESNEKLAAWIHDKYGRAAGLLRSDYYMHIDPDLRNSAHGGPCDVAIYAGGVIHIWIRYGPASGKAFTDCLAGVFVETRIKQFLRSKMIVKKTDALSWYGLERRFVDLPPISKKTKVRSVVTDVITMVRVREIKTNREEMVAVINGDAFSAQAEAFRRLLGSKFDET